MALWIRCLSRAVVPERRDAWEQEWRAEHAHARAAGGGGLRIAAAAFEDAMRLVPERVRSGASAADLRFALRSLRANPTFTAAAILTLGLGIGANTAIFSVIDAVMLKPLPLREPDRVVVLLKDGPALAGATSAPDFEDWRAQSESFVDLAAVHMWSANLVGADVPLRVTRARVTPGFFGILGVRPALGRDFREEEATPGRDRVVLLSHELWQSAFGGDPDVPGRTLRLDGVDFVVIGVAPRGLRVPPLTPRIWVPLALDADALAARGRNNLYVIGRLGAGVTLASAQTEMRAIGDRIGRAYPQTNEARSVRVLRLHDFALGTSPVGLWSLLACVLLVLVIACVNVANLVIARGVAREREFAIRVSLGASRGRLLTQMLAESVVLGVAGGVAGLALAGAALGPIRRLVPASLAELGDVSLNGRVLAFTLVVGLITGVAAGLLPALRLSRYAHGGARASSIAATLRVRGGTSRLRSVLAAAQYTLATILLVASILVVRSLTRLYSTDTGVRYDGVTAFGVTFPQATFTEPTRVILGVDGVLENLRATPGVESAAAVSHLPLTGSRLSSSVRIEGGPDAMSANGPGASIKVVTPGYFELLGVTRVQGRTFDETDRDGSEPVVVINRRAAATFWPGQDPIGRWISYTDGPDGQPLRRRVVGVIGDILFAGPSEPPTEEVYEVHRQTTNVWSWFGHSMTFVVRTSSGAPLDAPDAQRAIARVDPSLPIVGLGLLADRLDRSLATPRFNSALLASFGALAIVLAAIGMYGVLAFTVRRRTRELGIRLALGAEQGMLLRGVMADALRLALAGSAVGIAGALLLGRFLSSLLWGVQPTDPLTYVLVLAVMMTATLCAAWYPARRAASVDPLRSLQNE